MNEGADKALRDTLDAFFVQLQTDDALWSGIFDRMDATALANYKTNIRANPCTVRLGYPRDEEPWPVVSLSLASAAPEKDVATRSYGIVGGATPYEMFETVLAQQVVCHCVTRNIDETRILAALVLAGSLAARDYLTGQGYACLNPQGMQDLSPMESGLPAELHARIVSFSILELCQVNVTTVKHKITGPVYCGIIGDDLGHGHTGGVDPVTTLTP